MEEYVADTKEGIEQQVENIILASFAHQPGDEQDTTAWDDTGEKRVIDVDLYHLEGGAVLLVPKNGTNPLDVNSVESVAPPPHQQVPPGTETPPFPLVVDEQHEAEPRQDAQPEPAQARRRVNPSLVLVPLLLLCLLAAGAGTYLFVLPLTATATITITPQVKTLYSDTTFTIATNPIAGQVQGRPLGASSFTKSITVPATGHAHDDATSAAGVLTFYNADSQGSTIPAGTSFRVQGVTVVTDTTVTVQAAVPPLFGTGITAAHVIQAGAVGNIAAHAIETRCCGSAFLTATNTSAFTGGQNARTYSFVQTSDIHHAASDLIASLTPQGTAVLQHQAHAGEQLVTPVCRPHIQESAKPGTEGASVTVSVTQTCRSVAYLTDSLTQVATRTLVHSVHLTHYQQEGTVHVTVNGSTLSTPTAILNVSVSGVWVYHLTPAHVQHVMQELAGKSQQQARAILAHVEGVAQVSIHLQRLDFKDLLPTNPQQITVQWFYLVA